MSKEKPQLNYKDEIEIDQHNLDQEWLDQPRRFIKYASAQAQASFDVDKAKERLDVAKARADQDIRNNPQDYGISKVTESLVSNLITENTEYQHALKEYHQAKYEFEMAKAAVSAFHQRREALENLVRLWSSSYFSEPREPKDKERSMKDQAMSSVADEKVAARMKRRGTENGS